MEIHEMNNQDLLRNYAGLLKEMDDHYRTKKEFEEELKERFKERKL